MLQSRRLKISNFSRRAYTPDSLVWHATLAFSPSAKIPVFWHGRRAFIQLESSTEPAVEVSYNLLYCQYSLAG